MTGPIGLGLWSASMRGGGGGTPAPTPVDASPMQEIAIMGDSQASGGTYGSQLIAAFPDITFRFVAHGGWGLADVDQLIDGHSVDFPEVEPLNTYPDVDTVLVHSGANDGPNTGLYPTVEDYHDKQVAVTARIKLVCPNVKRVIFDTLMPVNVLASEIGFYDDYDPRRLAINARMRASGRLDAICPTGDDPIMGVYANTSDPTYFNDYLHYYTTDGQARVVAIYSALIAPLAAGSTATTPSAFAFADQSSIELSTQVETVLETPLTGMRVGHQVATSIIDGDSFGIGNSAFGTTSLNVVNGDYPKLRETSSGSLDTPTAMQFFAGLTSDSWLVETISSLPAVEVTAGEAKTNSPWTGLTLAAGLPVLFADSKNSGAPSLIGCVLQQGGVTKSTITQERNVSNILVGTGDVEIPDGDYDVVGAGIYFDAKVMVVTAQNTTSPTPTGSTGLNYGYAGRGNQDGAAFLSVPSGGLRIDLAFSSASDPTATLTFPQGSEVQDMGGGYKIGKSTLSATPRFFTNMPDIAPDYGGSATFGVWVVLT